MRVARENQRDALLAGAVDHVLHHGVATLSLRPLAAALGTSDRMLLYYFHTRDELLLAVLDAVGTQLQIGFETALGSDPLPPAALLRQAWSALQSPVAEPHLRLYVEVSGLAARGREPFRTVAAAVAQRWLAWVSARVEVPESERPAAAAGVLTVLDGLLLARFAGSEELATRAADWLAGVLDGRA